MGQRPNIAPFGETFRHVICWLSRPYILFWTLPYLMAILVTGTIAQKYLGLYETQRIFFSSFFIWLGPVPLPALYPALGVITLSLAIKFLFYSPWKISKIGIHISHLGVLMLLIGSLFTAITQREGFITIPVNGKSNFIKDYHKRELRIEKGNAILFHQNFDDFKKNKSIPLGDGLGSFTIKTLCKNCMPAMAENTNGRIGIAQKVTLTSVPKEKDDEQNLSGLEIILNNKNTYVLMERMSEKIDINEGENKLTVTFGRKTTALPFTFHLNNFSRENHPGTNEARAYRSYLTISDNGVEWPVTIEMNEPLRYKGYTFFQSAFLEGPKDIQTVLSAVENKGRVFPYLSSLLIFLGFLIHLCIRLATKET